MGLPQHQKKNLHAGLCIQIWWPITGTSESLAAKLWLLSSSELSLPCLNPGKSLLMDRCAYLLVNIPPNYYKNKKAFHSKSLGKILAVLKLQTVFDGI